MSPTTSALQDGHVTRRRWLQGVRATIGLAVGGGWVQGVLTIWAQQIRNVTLRQFDTGVSNINR